jgi:guanine deaminase
MSAVAGLPSLSAHRGALLHFSGDPGPDDDATAYQYLEDGLLLIADGRIAACGPAAALLPTLPRDLAVTQHGAQRLLMPGFIDTHIHFPQTDMIASGGRQLLDWLNDYTFPVEARFADLAHARDVASFFVDELMRNGTTTAQVFGSVHAASVDGFFGVARERGVRMIAGKVLMDRNCPDSVRDTAQSGERDTRALIERWHGVDRLAYAITPRFAPTSTEAQLDSAGRIARDHPDVYIHSHLAENHGEIAWVRQLFPWSAGYLDVYERYGLLRERATYAHCLHLSADERRRLGASGACAACSPTSNLYLGSGLFDFDASDAAGLRYALATDVGGGTSFSQLRTMAEAYKVAQMQGQRLPALRAFYLATLGGARALHLQDRIGSFRVGNEADFIVLDWSTTPLMQRRIAATQRLDEKLLALMMLGDDRLVAQTYILGQAVLP